MPLSQLLRSYSPLVLHLHAHAKICTRHTITICATFSNATIATLNIHQHRNYMHNIHQCHNLRSCDCLNFLTLLLGEQDFGPSPLIIYSLSWPTCFSHCCCCCGILHHCRSLLPCLSCSPWPFHVCRVEHGG